MDEPNEAQRPFAVKLWITGLACLVSMFLSPRLAAQGVLTWHNDAARTGQNLTETLLSPSNVNSSSFGLLFTLPVDGKVDAQPLYVPSVTISGVPHNVVYVATENDTVYAFDADTGGSALWSKSVLLSGETASDDRGCGNVSPTIGILATPAIDLSSGPHGTIYVAAMSKDGSGNYSSAAARVRHYYRGRAKWLADHGRGHLSRPRPQQLGGRVDVRSQAVQ